CQSDHSTPRIHEGRLRTSSSFLNFTGIQYYHIGCVVWNTKICTDAYTKDTILRQKFTTSGGRDAYLRRAFKSGEYEYIKPVGASDTSIHYFNVSHKVELPAYFKNNDIFTFYTARKFDASQVIKNIDIKDAKGTFREGKFEDGTYESVHVVNTTTFRQAVGRRRLLYNNQNVNNFEKQVLTFYLINVKNLDELNKSVKIILDFNNDTGYLSTTVSVDIWLNVFVEDE
ncbi:Hypothetical predicted protein, partial [Paramuricea clavata]